MSLASTSMIWNGQGPVMIGTYDPVKGRPEMGFLTNLYSVGCGNRTLTATPSRETTTIPESCSGQRLALKELETSKSLAVSLAMVQFDGRTLAQAFFGAAVVKAAGTVTNEVLTELAPGDYFFLKNPRSSSVVIEDSTAGTPLVYVEGTHYEISDADHSRYRLLAHPAAHVEPLKVDYAYAGYVNIAAFSKTNVERGIIFSGRARRRVEEMMRRITNKRTRPMDRLLLLLESLNELAHTRDLILEARRVLAATRTAAAQLLPGLK